jgi:hypothetical protein
MRHRCLTSARSRGMQLRRAQPRPPYSSPTDIVKSSSILYCFYLGLTTQPRILLRAHLHPRQHALGGQRVCLMSVARPSADAHQATTATAGSSNIRWGLTACAGGFDAAWHALSRPVSCLAASGCYGQRTGHRLRCMHENCPKSSCSTPVRCLRSFNSMQAARWGSPSSPVALRFGGRCILPSQCAMYPSHGRCTPSRWCRSLKSSAFVPSLQACRKPVQVFPARKCA